MARRIPTINLTQPTSDQHEGSELEQPLLTGEKETKYEEKNEGPQSQRQPVEEEFAQPGPAQVVAGIPNFEDVPDQGLEDADREDLITQNNTLLTRRQLVQTFKVRIGITRQNIANLYLLLGDARNTLNEAIQINNEAKARLDRQAQPEQKRCKRYAKNCSSCGEQTWPALLTLPFFGGMGWTLSNLQQAKQFSAEPYAFNGTQAGFDALGVYLQNSDNRMDNIWPQRYYTDILAMIVVALLAMFGIFWIGRQNLQKKITEVDMQGARTLDIVGAQNTVIFYQDRLTRELNYLSKLFEVISTQERGLLRKVVRVVNEIKPGSIVLSEHKDETKAVLRVRRSRIQTQVTGGTGNAYGAAGNTPMSFTTSSSSSSSSSSMFSLMPPPSSSSSSSSSTVSSTSTSSTNSYGSINNKRTR